MQVKFYKKGDIICEVGDEGHEFYIIISGEVAISIIKPATETMSQFEMIQYV